LGKALKVRVIGSLVGLACCANAVACLAAYASDFTPLKLGGSRVHWRSAHPGQAPIVTYAILRKPLEVDGARNCRKLSAFDDLEVRSQLSDELVRRETAAAFTMWQAAANIDFRETTLAERANIIIGAQGEPEGWAFSNVSYNAQSPEAIKPITQSLICLNPLRRWKIGFDGNLKIYDIRYTIAHEIGHAIGLDHPDDDDQIMGYRYQEHFRVLQPGDVAGVTLLYGAHRPYIIAESHPPLLPRRSLAERGWGARAFVGRARSIWVQAKKVSARKSFTGPPGTRKAAARAVRK
jgi:predicted Zn-dependent protease